MRILVEVTRNVNNSRFAWIVCGVRHIVRAVTCWPLKRRYGFRDWDGFVDFLDNALICFKAAVRIAPLGLLFVALSAFAAPGMAQSTSPAFSIEAGVTSPRDPTATFGLIVGERATRSYSRFAYKADGSARQVETGIERAIYQSKRFDIIGRGRAGIAQDENNTSGTVGASFGFLVRLRWGLSLVALGDGDNAPIKDGEWRGGASLTVRWKAQ